MVYVLREDAAEEAVETTEVSSDVRNEAINMLQDILDKMKADQAAEDMAKTEEAEDEEAAEAEEAAEDEAEELDSDEVNLESARILFNTLSKVLNKKSLREADIDEVPSAPAKNDSDEDYCADTQMVNPTDVDVDAEYGEGSAVKTEAANYLTKLLRGL